MLRFIRRRFCGDFQRLELKKAKPATVDGGSKKLKVSRRVQRRNDLIKRLSDAGPHYKEIDYKENFVYGFEKEDFEGCNPILKQAFSLTNATNAQIMQFKKARAVEKYQTGFSDTGSPAVQVACLTEKIVQLVYHFKNNLKDYIALRKISMLNAQRNKILNYLRSKDPNRFIQIVRDYNLPVSPNEITSYIHFKQPHKKSGVAPNRRYDDHNREKPDPFLQGRVTKFKGWTPRYA